jgi:hypothetical protein
VSGLVLGFLGLVLYTYTHIHTHTHLRAIWAAYTETQRETKENTDRHQIAALDPFHSRFSETDDQRLSTTTAKWSEANRGHFDKFSDHGLPRFLFLTKKPSNLGHPFPTKNFGPVWPRV